MVQSIEDCDFILHKYSYVVEPTNGRSNVHGAYRRCIQDKSRRYCSLQEGTKAVVQYANDIHPECCLVRLYKLYVSKCPVGCLDGAFYLKPLAKPTGTCWYQKVPVGHNTSQKTTPVSRLCNSAGFDGNFTNHFLCATTAMRFLRLKYVDKQLIMQRTGHTSSAVRT